MTSMVLPFLTLVVSLVAALPANAGQALNIGSAEQIYSGKQSGVNSLYLNFDTSDAGHIWGAAADQSTTNVANALEAKSYTVESINQTMEGHQSAVSVYIDDAARNMEKLSQFGQNLSNVVMANRIENIAQYLGDNASQSVVNTIRQASQIATIGQYGVNVANVAEASVSIGSGIQVFPSGAVQIVENDVTPTGHGRASKVDQVGQNFGNVLVADKVENVSRIFAGRQEVDNNFLNAPGVRVPRTIEQSGLNVANYISASVVSNVSQISTGTQVVTNTAYDSDRGTISAATPGIHQFDQSSSNFVNLTVINPAPESSGEPISLTQNASMPQSTNGAGSQSQIGNMVAISR